MGKPIILFIGGEDFMGDKIKCFVSKKWNILLYLVFLGVVVVSVVNIALTDKDIDFKISSSADISSDWNYEFKGGEKGTTDLPGDLPMSESYFLYLKKTLPDISANTEFVFKARHTFVKIMLDGKVLFDNLSEEAEKDNWCALDGINYIEVEMKPEYSGRELTIVSYCTEWKYLCEPGSVYLGERGSFMISLIRNRMPTYMWFVILFLIGLVLLVLWLAMLLTRRTSVGELLCLSFFTTGIGAWVMTEAQVGQLLGYGTRALTYLAYEILMIIPIPIALFFRYACERPIGKKQAQVAAIIPAVLFVINNAMHSFKLLPLTESLLLTQMMLIVELFLISYIQIAEFRYFYIHGEQRKNFVGIFPLIGVVILIPLTTIEILKYIFEATHYPNDGRLISMGVVIYIVTLALDSLARINYKSTKIEQSVESKTLFLANMSHEIRTPLNAMLGFNEAILQNTKDELIQGYAYNVFEAGENLKGIINSILDISKIEMGQLQIDSKEFNSVQMLDNLVSMFELLAKRNGLDFNIDIDPKLPEVMIGDEQHLRGVLINILSNAVKYTDEGSITFTVKVVENEAGSPAYKILFSVKDTGQGIREEDKDRLFQKFIRLDQDHFRHTEGTGLGMSIVMHTLRAMGSEIQLNSVYGEGTEFYFELELCSVSDKRIGDFNVRREENSNKQIRCNNFRAPNVKVLIVDDVEMNIEAAIAVLGFTKIKFYKSLSGEEAIEDVKNMHYDMIFMDHMMPDMNGIEATEIIRNMAVETGNIYYATVPIIALTANAIVGMREIYQQSGMQDLVSKPIEIGEMIRVLRKWLPAELWYEDETVDESEDGQEGDWNIDVKGISVEDVKKYNTDLNCLRNNMISFSKGYDKNCFELRELLDSNNIDNYIIKVHSLKSTSKMIGAMELSETARLIEEKGKDGGEATEEEFQHLMELYGGIIKNIREYLNLEDETAKEASLQSAISEEEYQSLIERIKTAAEGFNSAEIMMLYDELDKIAVAEEHKEEFDKLKDMVGLFSFGDIVEYFSSREEDS